MRETIYVPDVGSSDPVDVIEISVNVGDVIAADDTIIVLESDKATVEVPAPFGGEVQAVSVKMGDRVKEGDALIELIREGDKADPAVGDAAPSDAPQPTSESTKAESAEPQTASGNNDEPIAIVVPDLGDISGAEIIEVNVAEGDVVEAEQIVAVLESDKASLEIPSPHAGRIVQLQVNVGDTVNTGSPLLMLAATGDDAVNSAASPASMPESNVSTPAAPSSPQTPQAVSPVATTSAASSSSPSAPVHAGPAVRKLAREMGVDLSHVRGTGPKQRILKDDVHAWVKAQLESSTGGAPQGNAAFAGMPALPEIDFSQFGDIEPEPLSKLRKVSARNLTRAWLTIPHVTQHDDADITELEAFRKQQNAQLGEDGAKLTMLAFLVVACANALSKFPRFNASLDNSGETLIVKQYINIGIAVDTPNGLVVPVIKNADQKSLSEIAREMAELAKKARDRKLSPADMQGGTFSISSLGGIGGTAFTPIVNWPEVAILGVSRSAMQPVWNGHEFAPRLMLPLSLSYDHRVIDGADAARFTTYLSSLLADMRRVLL